MKNSHSAFVTAFLIFILVFSNPIKTKAEDGYDLWLRYKKIENPDLLKNYQLHLKNVVVKNETPTFNAVEKELKTALPNLLDTRISFSTFNENGGNLIVALRSASNFISENVNESELKKLGNEGFLIRSFKSNDIIITGNTDVGILYGVFRFLEFLQQEKDISNLNFSDAPKTKIRILNHWDNLDRTVERGYAGFSLWDWFRLPDVADPRYTDYARANASIGINGSVITNVNANALILTPLYLEKIAKLADVFRPYGIKVYLTARFSAPIELDKLPTADPLDSQVQLWWKNKAEEIYKYIPDFGGFLVKANSEGQPGPQNYNRNHAEGANLLADAVAPFGGIVMWRAFVYDQN
ncbi:MAG TPA: alpha-glucuronidase family glycosyl hydrolase, partial [Draconibacterium sp.]|nr:alpha-glucuronidase family glycosyl hydrolase [Draconibacterium sp.]